MSEVEIVRFQDQFSAVFGRLNYEWIERSYGIEEHDHEILDHPMESVIEPGGQIFFAVKEGVARVGATSHSIWRTSSSILAAPAPDAAW